MRQKLLAHGFTVTACLFLGVYHYYAWQWNGLPELTKLWQPAEILIQSPSQASVKLGVWHVDTEKEAWNRNGVFNSRFLGFFGHILNYWQDRPGWFLIGQKRPTLWLFSDEDLVYQGELGLTEVASSYGTDSRRFVERLRKRGVTCILLPVPSKSMIERNSIPATWKLISDPGVVYRKIVEADPAWTADLFSSFTAYKREHPDEVIYRPLDHHWGSLGAVLAVSETLNVLRKHGWNIPEHKKKFLRTLSGDDPNIEMNYRKLLFLPSSFIKAHAELDWNEKIFDLEPKYQSKSQAKSQVTGSGRVLVFGTSFSAQLRGIGLSYAQLLAGAVGRTLVDYTNPGSNFLFELRRSLKEGVKFMPGDLIVIEFPMKHLSYWNEAKDFHDLD